MKKEIKRVLYIVHNFPRLYHTFLLNDMIRLREKGIDVYILSLGKPDGSIVNEDAKSFLANTFYLDDYNTRIHTFPLKQLIRILKNIKSRIPSVYNILTSLLLRFYNDTRPMKTYFPEFGWRLFAVNRFSRILHSRRIDIIHAGFANTTASAALILSEMNGIPFTFEAHANDIFVRFPHPEEKLSKAKKIITISNYNKKYLIDRYQCDATKIIVKRVPFNRDYCDEILGTERESNTIVSVGRLDPIKGLSFGIDAVSRVVKENPHVMYWIVGDGVLRDKLAEQVNALDLNRNIQFLGSMENKRALDLIARSTVFMLPSVIATDGDRDGIPTALIEAMYLRTSVIGSNISGIPELIDNDCNGYLIDPGDVDELAVRLNSLLVNPSLREKFGMNARQKVIAEFNIEVNNDKLLRAWD
jgi:colanic acid/amylovoran biosynthesis glycosyltransferase